MDITHSKDLDTYEKVRQIKRPIPDKIVLNWLRNESRYPLGEPFSVSYGLYKLISRSRPSEEEFMLTKQPQPLAALRGSIVQMISENLTLQPKGDEDGLGQLRKAYIEKLGKEQLAVARVYDEFNRTGKVPDLFWPKYKNSYLGLIVPSTIGDVDVMKKGGKFIHGIRPSIKIASGSHIFIHWETSGFINARLNDENVNLDSRIYLNPKTSEIVGAFTEIMKDLESAGLIVSAKMLDRSYELAHAMRENKFTVRPDGIVISGNRAEFNKILNIVLRYYGRNEEVFLDTPTNFGSSTDLSQAVDRKTPVFAAKIRPGIAISDEPILRPGELASFSSHRASVIDDVLQTTRDILKLPGGFRASCYHPVEIPKEREAEAVAVFRDVFQMAGMHNLIDVNNVAFNLPHDEPGEILEIIND